MSFSLLQMNLKLKKKRKNDKWLVNGKDKTPIQSDLSLQPEFLTSF